MDIFFACLLLTPLTQPFLQSLHRFSTSALFLILNAALKISVKILEAIWINKTNHDEIKFARSSINELFS